MAILPTQSRSSKKCRNGFPGQWLNASYILGGLLHQAKD